MKHEMRIELSDFELARAAKGKASQLAEIRANTPNFRMIRDCGPMCQVEVETGTGELARVWVDPLGLIDRLRATLPDDGAPMVHVDDDDRPAWV